MINDFHHKHAYMCMYIVHVYMCIVHVYMCIVYVYCMMYIV